MRRLGGLPRIAFAPDGRTLAAVSGTVRRYDVATGQQLPLWRNTSWATGCLAYSTDGMLATGHVRWYVGRGDQHEISLRAPATARTWCVLRGHSHRPTALAFSPNGMALAAAGGRSLYVWDVPSKRRVLAHHINDRHFNGVAFSPDGRWLATAHNDQTVRFFDTRTWREHIGFDWQIGPVVAVAFAPDGMRAAAGSNKGKIVLWDVDL
jgi:WD40 repeat protein